MVPSDDEIEAQLAYENLKRGQKARKRKRIIRLAIIGAIVVAAGIVFFVMRGRGGDETQLDPFAMPGVVRQGEFTSIVNGAGKTQPIASSVVEPEIPGIIQNLSVRAGQTVNAGDVLFTVKNDDLDEQVRKAQDDVDEKRRQRNHQDHKVDSAYQAREIAWNKANESQDWSTYDESALNAAIYDAEDAVEDADAALAVAETALEEAQSKADKRTVTAPVTGDVIAVNAQNGQSIGGAAGGTSSSSSSGAQSGPLVQIADTTQMKVSVDINEVDIEKIAVGQEAMVTFQALPELNLQTTVQNIASVSSGTSSSSEGEGGGSGVVTYAIDLTVPNDGNRIKQGMTANVAVTIERIDNTLVVPAGCVQSGPEGDYVLRITDTENKQYEKVPITVTAKNSSEAAVTGNLIAGDQLLMQDPEAAASLDALAAGGGSVG